MYEYLQQSDDRNEPYDLFNIVSRIVGIPGGTSSTRIDPHCIKSAPHNV